MKGTRFINGKEYLLAGRCTSKESAVSQKTSLAKSWESVRIIKLWQYDFMLYVHGRRHSEEYPRPSTIHYSTEAKQAGWKDRD